MRAPEAYFATNNPVGILQDLIRFDTTNPPGNEGPCIEYMRELLENAGIRTQILAKNENRPNLVARIPGDNTAPPLLLYGHVDVVTAKSQTWQYPPFEGRLVDGYVWGRGALDMKGGLAMMVSAMLRLARQQNPPAGDIVFAAVSDEESGGIHGARFLVENHPALFAGIRYAIGEFGGASMDFGGRRFYPIQVSEKQVCSIRATARGMGGHGSMPIHGGAMGTIGKLLCNLDRRSLPVRITPTARQMTETISDNTKFPYKTLIKQLLNPRLADSALFLIGQKSRTLSPLLRNTVSPTMIQGGHKINVIPSEVILHMDGRMVPGCTPEELIEEVRKLADGRIALEVLRHEPGPPEPDMDMFDLLSDVIRSADPDGITVPLLLPGVTDARFFSRLGIQTYGFTPLKLPRDFDYFSFIHNADERVPADAVEFGANAVHDLLCRYGRAG
ncbi:MAG: M20/M25/M40 family metallo-hydrolase [Desulfobacteraceae bacterium]|nr:M20/M25/M40 family metallo-hydrolase [Desulfobacteraceae bacterium]